LDPHANHIDHRNDLAYSCAYFIDPGSGRDVGLLPVVKDALVYANLILMLTIGFTLAYMTAKIPNFAHGTLAGIGVYSTFTVSVLWGLSPYTAVLVAFVLGAGTAVFVYKVVIGTLRKCGATPISLSISTLAVEIIVIAILNMYADFIQTSLGKYARFFLLRYKDFEFAGLPGVLLASTILVVAIVAGLHLMLTRTKFGISMRATVEDPDLASVLGTNVELVSTVSWFLTGGLAGVSGSLLPLWFQGDPTVGSVMMTSVFAASALGGLSSIYGAMLGGYLIGLSEILGTVVLMDAIGSWVAAYRMLIPLTVLSLVLLRCPRGLVGVIEVVRAEGLGIRGMVKLGRVRSRA